MIANISNNDNNDNNDEEKTFECVCCGGIFPISERRHLGYDDVCEDCFWAVREIEQW